MPPIFVQQSQEPLSISVDLYLQSKTVSRHDIVRKIKGNGGVVTPPERASIVLINPEVKESRKPFFVWKANTQKVILNVEWIGRCLAEERLLGAEDDWAGLRITDLPDGESGDEDEDAWDEEERDAMVVDNQIHLATPRPSPVTLNTQAESSSAIRTRPSAAPRTPESLSTSTSALHRPESPKPAPTMSAKAKGKRPAVPRGSSSADRKASTSSVQPTSSKGMFKNKSFWIQPDAKNRADIIQLIKKHGGGIGLNMNEADYCILSPKSTTYKDLYTRTLKARKPPLGYGWLEECDREGDILPPEQWLLEAHGRLVHPVTAARFAIEDEDVTDSASQGDGDSNMLNSKDSRDNRLMEEAIVQLFAEEPNANSRDIFEKVHTLFDKKYGVAFLEMYYLSNLTRLQQDIARQRAVTHTTTRGTFPDAPASHYQRDHLLNINQPKPTPPTKVEAMGGGKNRFTKEEQEYLYDLCRYSFLRNPRLTKSALLKDLVELVPSHPYASWQAYLVRKDEEIDTIRKQAVRTREKFPDAFPSESDSEESTGESPRKRRRKS